MRTMVLLQASCSCPFRAGANGTSTARLRRGAEVLQAAGRDELRRHVGRRDQLQGASLRAASRADAADGVRSRRQFHPRLRRRAVRPAARAAHRCGRQHLGDRRRRRTWPTSSIRPGRLEMVLGVQGPARRDGTTSATCGCSTSRTRRWSARPATSSCCRATARATSLVSEVRQGRQLHQDLGQEGQGAGRVRPAAFAGVRRQGAALHRRPQQRAHPGVRRRRQLHPRVEAIPARRAGCS